MNKGRLVPVRIEWILFDPLDGASRMRVTITNPSVRDIPGIRREIQAAPKTFRNMCRRDGRTLGMRRWKTSTRLFYVHPL